MKVLLVDACRDDPDAARGSRGGITADSVRPPAGVAALFSCRAGERAFEHAKLGHGVFFYHVLEGLKGKAKDADNEVTFAGLAAYVSRRVAKDVPVLVGGTAKQSPNLKADYSTEPVLVSLAARSAKARSQSEEKKKQEMSPTVVFLKGQFTQGAKVLSATLKLSVQGGVVTGEAVFRDINGIRLQLDISGTLKGSEFSAKTFNAGKYWSNWRGKLDMKKGTLTGSFQAVSGSGADLTPGAMSFSRP
jgi:hypothetical protein